jgi:hypothetical protein
VSMVALSGRLSKLEIQLAGSEGLARCDLCHLRPTRNRCPSLSQAGGEHELHRHLHCSGSDAVKLPRLSIISVMWIVVIASINLAGLRLIETPTTALLQTLVIVSMPMASVLVIGIPTLVRCFLGRGKMRLFLNGFEGFGWTILLFFTGMAWLAPIWFAEAVAIIWGWSGLTERRDSFWQSFIFFDMFLCLVPQLLIALIGGWLVGMFKIRVTVERRAAQT